MDNVATLRADNANLRKIQSKLVQWELKENPLAALSTGQTDFINRLTDLVQGNNPAPISTAGDSDGTVNEGTVELPASLESFKQSACVIDTTQNFLSWYNSIDAEILEHFDEAYLEYYEQLRLRASECDTMLQEIDESLGSLRKLTQEFNFVSEKTSSLHRASESLLQDQTKLSDSGEEIRKRLKYFSQAESISQRLHNPTVSVSNESFADVLNTIDDCIEYMRVNPSFCEASAYSVKYRTCLAKAAQMMKVYVTNILANATAQVLAPKGGQGAAAPRSLEALEQLKVGDRATEAAFALFYGKFQASAPRVKRITGLIEERLDRSPDYEILLGELHQTYLTQRATIMSGGVDQAIKELAKKHKGDHCALVRSACAFMVHICQDEHRLFYHFFAKPSEQLIGYMEGLCTILYDILRPYIIRIDHLETLAEICSILKVEMLDEHVAYSPDSLEAFAKIVYQLLQDVQERIGFRAQNYLESDIRNYRPSAGDLAYPEKLEMMESIALSLQDNAAHQHHHHAVPLRRVDSRSSIVSGMSLASQDTVSETPALRSRASNSPADMHGMWYPTVRRTLVCLSRLYRCIDKSIFQSLSQQALAHCIHSVSSAAAEIAKNRTTIDGELFEIKHLLILREQIAPFRVDFTAKETSLDFSKVRTAAYELLQKRKQLFSLGSNNALLEFLLDGTPQVREQLLDSRKDVDRQLKAVCETFITDASRQLVGPVLTFIETAQNHLRNQPAGKAPAGQQQQQQQQQGGGSAMALRLAPFAAPQQISSIIQESLRNIKTKLAGLQRSMQLYLSNKDTEFILFRPIRNNIIGAFVKLEQILMLNAYTKDDLTIVSCPSAEQISVLLSSVNLSGATGPGGETTAAFGRPQTVEAQRKISTSSSVGSGGHVVKAPIEKKVSFDSGANTVVEIERTEDVVTAEEAVEHAKEATAEVTEAPKAPGEQVI